MNDDINEMAREDVEKFKNLSGDGMEWSLPAMIELVLGALTTGVVLTWLISMYWVPDPIDGSIWMGLGMLGAAVFGLPLAVIVVMRRGGADVIRAVVRGVVG